ncbi:Putative mRNA decapping protein 2, Box A [Septoria linicola]|uniref:mRNA decapping protein 2, Box A n=1 Tax=Septoria linicola TaxID=215465 RepID=A0A9Q9EGM5_9PEZI|nr:Putative mRNA decapping protein 2, Box A [Septoria linicola]
MAEAADQTISHMTLVDWLDDLTVRFLLNLPPAELSSVPRLCFQVEEAQWFYEDFIRPANPALPSLNLRQFCLTLFQHCPLLSGFNAAQHLAAYEEFLAYKVRVPVRGAILMDESMDKVLLVRGWKKGASWSFPRGKINKDEPDLDCAVREVYEETGFDLQAAGLVDRNKIGDGKVKAIDVTMREQHMKLFVFRGVALDTYFEPRTRKEIGKIQWYNVKDLPGFKKQKGVAGHGQGEAESVKFYMVAPFLGHLKKWIGQQRRKDSAEATQVQHDRSVSLPYKGVQTTITEDEGEDTEAGFATDNGLQSIDRSADELKRLLSIGGAAPVPDQPAQPAQSPNGAQANSLLAMLRGNIVAPSGSTLPHTPYGQVDPVFPEQAPQTPQPQHPRHASAAASYHQNAPPEFQYSPQTMQQGLQQQQSQRHSATFNTVIANNSNHQQPGISHLPPYIQQQMFQQQRQQSLPASFSSGGAPGAQFHQRPGSSESRQISQPLEARNAHAHNLLAHFQSTANQNQNPTKPFGLADMPQQRPASRHASTAVARPIGSERAVPEASSLPAPKLNAHSMKLLDAFKTGPRTTRPSGSTHAKTQPSGAQHQTALLDLFRKPSTANDPPALARRESVAAPGSPALTDATEVPEGRKLERKPTLNEITRTLPPKEKAELPALPVQPDTRSTEKVSPVQRERPTQLQPPRTASASRGVSSSMLSAVPHDVETDRPRSRGQLFDPAQPKRFVRAASQSKQSAIQPHVAPVPTASRTGSDAQSTSRSSKSPRPATKAPAQASPKPKGKQARNDNGPPRQVQPVPQFSILQRPGSSRSPAPMSPSRDESLSSKQQPQVLKREAIVEDDEPPAAQRPSSVVKTPASGDKKDTLLALFGKAPLSPAAPAPSPMPATGVAPTLDDSPSQSAGQQRNPLLDLFNGNRAEITIKTPEPPPSPQLLPETKPSAQGQRPQSSQQHLLNLFTKTSANVGSRLNSPGTPVSPFTLGTPATNTSMEKLPSAAYDSRVNTPRGSEPMSRLGSMASVMSNGAGAKSGAQTPTEAKDLLLGYLNGVVQKEGYRGAKKPA